MKIREKAKNRQEASRSGVQDLRKKEGMKEEINERRRRGERRKGRKESEHETETIFEVILLENL